MSKYVGRTFGPYTVKSLHHTVKKRGPKQVAYYQYLLVRCVCGHEIIRLAQSLNGLRTPDCPHMPSMSSQQNEKRLRSMHNRCYNPRHSHYKYYGGKGVRVSSSWSLTLAGLQRFNADMGPCPGPGYSIDRLDPHGDYSPENCRWATRSEQARNKRPKGCVEYQGYTMTLTQHARRLNIQRHTVFGRKKKGWPLDQILRTTTKRGKPLKPNKEM